MTTLNAKVILNVKTAAEWANSMEILLEGELGIESDTRLIKIGNGVDTFISLPYTAVSEISGIEGVTITSPTDGQVLTYSNGEWINVTPSALPADTDLSHYDNSISGFITASDIPALPADTDLSHYDNTTSDFATVSQIPTDVSQLNNDAGYITSSALPSVGDGTIIIQKNSVNVDSFTTNQNTNKTINITVPTLLSELSNDVGYVTSATLPPVNNGTLIIRQDGNTIATFTANSATNVVANITGGGGGGGGGASYTSQLTVDSSLIPDTDSVYNLGDSTHRWTYLYSQYLSTGDGSALIAEQSIIPTTDATYNLGSSGKAWRTLYASQINGDGSSIEISGTIYPSVDEMDSLGGNVSKWSEIHTKDLLVYNDLYTDTLKAKTTNGDITVDTNLLCDSGGYYNLGSSTTNWSKGYIYQVFSDNINVDNTITLGTSSSRTAYINMYDGGGYSTAYMKFSFDGLTCAFAPNSNNAAQLGDTSNGWKHIYANGATITGDVVPGTGSYKLGNLSSHWTTGWIDDLYVAAGSSYGIYFGTDTSHSYIRDVTSNTLYLHATNQVVADSPNFRPQGNDSDLGHQYHRWSTIWYTTLNPPSDIRLKENIEPLESGLKIVNDLDIKSFTFKNTPDHIEYGIIAQDVVEKYPELISVPDSEEGTYGTYLHNFIFASLRAIQELSSKVDELHAKIKVLEAKL